MNEFAVSSESLAIIKRGVSALRRLDSDKNFQDWLIVGEAVMEVRRLAMRRAGSNAPFGRAYTAAFAHYFEHYKLAERLKDKGDRDKLVNIMEALPQVTAWRETLTPADRRRWNHPATVWRQFQRAQKEALSGDPEEETSTRGPTAKQQITALKTEVHRLRKGGHLPWSEGDSPEDKARSLAEHLSVDEMHRVGMALVNIAAHARTSGGEEADQ